MSLDFNHTRTAVARFSLRYLGFLVFIFYREGFRQIPIKYWEFSATNSKTMCDARQRIRNILT